MMTDEQQEEIPRMKIIVQRGSQAGFAGTISGISPNSIHSAREKSPRVSMYFFRR